MPRKPDPFGVRLCPGAVAVDGSVRGHCPQPSKQGPRAGACRGPAGAAAETGRGLKGLGNLEIGRDAVLGGSGSTAQGSGKGPSVMGHGRCQGWLAGSSRKIRCSDSLGLH
jgi:hypothetical protein